MSDGGPRPRDDRAVRDTSSVDVPLTGADMPSRARRGDPDREPPAATDWRRLARLALVGGAALGVAVAVVRTVADDGDTDRSGRPGVEATSAITTPPTLRPLETLPPPDGDDAHDDVRDQPAGTASTGTSGGLPSPEAVVAPTYRPASDPAPDIGDDLASAVERNDDDVARRSDTHVELGYGGYVLDVSIVRDPERDRYRIEFESRGNVEQVIVDVATGTTYIAPGTEHEIRIPNEEVTGNIDTNLYFDRLLRGPLRSDTYDPAATRQRGVVTIDGVGPAREFTTVIDGELAPEWQIYAFGPVSEFVPADRPVELAYSAYVDGSDRIVQVDGVSMIDDVPQLVRHRLTVLDEPIEIELPVDTSPTTMEDRG